VGFRPLSVIPDGPGRRHDPGTRAAGLPILSAMVPGSARRRRLSGVTVELMWECKVKSAATKGGRPHRGGRIHLNSPENSLQTEHFFQVFPVLLLFRGARRRCPATIQAGLTLAVGVGLAHIEHQRPAAHARAHRVIGSSVTGRVQGLPECIGRWCPGGGRRLGGKQERD